MESKSDGSPDSVLTRFFAELAPRLETAKDLERELDRKLAHRFNIFEYLRDGELGLSRIIADLLNPKTSHGQGTLFLRTLLDLAGLNDTPGWPDVDGNYVSIDVKPEYTIPGGRLDILVRIQAGRQAYGLAIENKPYAKDDANQVQHYLKYLGKKYDERFLLIYLSPNGKAPSEESLPEKERDKWKGRFAIMSYYGGQEDQAEKFDAFRIPHSLAGWLGECRKNCEVDRLRWFLRDAEIFCQQRFGGQAMVNSIERKTVFDFLLRNPGNLESAWVVSESWPDVRDHVCEKFLKGLCSQIEAAVKEHEKLKEFADGMQIGHEYTGSDGRSRIWLYRDCWTRYAVEPSDLNGRTSIRLETDKQGPAGWFIGVASPMSVGEMTNGDKERRQRLVTELNPELGRGRVESWWPWWEWVDEDKRNWNSLVPDLHQEYEGKDDKITRYFVDEFIGIAEKAIPVINGIEG